MIIYWLIAQINWFLVTKIISFYRTFCPIYVETSQILQHFQTDHVVRFEDFEHRLWRTFVYHYWIFAFINVLSAYISPIKHILDELKRRVYARWNPATPVQQLRNAVDEEWQTIPQMQIATIIRSMCRLCVALMKSLGGYMRFWLYNSIYWMESYVAFKNAFTVDCS